MTLSYNIGLTGGSIAAYMLDSLLGPPLVKACEGFLPLGPTTRPRLLPRFNTTTSLPRLTTVATTLLAASNLTTESFNLTVVPTLPSLLNATTTLGLV